MERERDASGGTGTAAEGGGDIGSAGKRSRVAARYPALAQALGGKGGDSPSIHDAATAAVEHKGGGAPVDGGVAARVGGHLGADFSSVRVHSDPLSQEATQAMGARAFAYGGDVFLGPGESGGDLGLMAHELTHVVQQGAAGQRALQPKVTVGDANTPAEREADQVASEVTGGGRPRALLVDDGPVQPGQMLKSSFIDELRGQVTAAADAELGPIYSAIGCPYIDQYFSRYANRPASEGEALLRRFAPAVQQATTAAAMIAPVVERVRAGVRQWRETGQAPSDLPIPGEAAGAAASASAQRAPDGRETLASLEHDLGPGQPLDGATASRMQDAFGIALPDVRLHTGAVAARKAAAVDAVAFTVGTNIVMGASAPAAGTIDGDALLAHELAHTVQQADAARDQVARRQPIGGESASAEAGADHAAEGAVGALHGRKDLGGRFADAWKTGLQLQRCPNNNNNNQQQQQASIGNYRDATNAANDPGRLSEQQIRATAEYATLRQNNAYTEAEATLAIRLAIRDLQQGVQVDISTQGNTYLARARSQGGAAGGAEGLVGNLNWVQYSSATVAVDPMALDDDFSKWLLAAQAQPDPQTGKMNCWELVMFGAFRAGVVTEQRLRAIYTLARQNVQNGVFQSVGQTFETECRGSQPVTYQLGSATTPRPLRGDIVVYENAPNHACIATGTTIVNQISGQTESEVISLWTPNNRHVERTTIEALAQVSTGRPILFWSARWT